MTICVANRALPKESLRKLVTDFFKTFKIVDFRRDFCTSLMSDFLSKHSCSVHFCLMDLMMISQTAQYWSSDNVSSSLRSEKEIFRSTSITGSGFFFLTLEDERLTVFVCYHHAVRGFELF